MFYLPLIMYVRLYEIKLHLSLAVITASLYSVPPEVPQFAGLLVECQETYSCHSKKCRG